MADLIQGINTLTTEGTDHTPIMVPDMGDISAGHSPTPIPTVTEAAVEEDTPHAPLQATTVAHATIQLMDASITPCDMIPTGSHTTSHTCHFSHRCHSYHSIDLSWSHFSNSHYTAQGSQPRKVKQCPRPSTPP